MLTEQIAVVLTVCDSLDAMGVAYAIGGSFASALHGVARATMDADLVADLSSEHVEPLVRSLGAAFYADAKMMTEAIQRHSCFNLIHLDTMFKVDIFAARPHAFERSQLARRTLQQLSDDPERYAYVCTAEDTILAKLEWYRRGHEISDRQIRDVLGVIRVQAGRLDWPYMKSMALELGVSDLLERCADEAG